MEPKNLVNRQSSELDSVSDSRIRKTTDFRVLPLLVICFATYQLERTNIASALTGGFADVISANQNTINLGNQLMFLGVVVLEIPSNLILQRVGPRRWISVQVFIFGAVAALQVFVKDKTGFLLTRAILGLAESGFIPGAMYTLSTWYTKEQLTKRIAIFFFGMFGGNAVSPLLGAGLLRLEVEGILSMVVAIVLFFLLPEKPSAKTQKNELNDDTDGSDRADTDEHNKPIPYQDIWRTLINIRKWPHFIATACVFSTWSPLTTYTPSIIMSLGFSRVESNAIAAIGNFATLPVILFFAWLSDKTKRHGLIVMVAIAAYLIALILLRTVQPHVGQWSRIGLWTTVNGLAVGYHPIHNAWIQINCKTAAERSISVAMIIRMFVMTATSGLMAGTQIFRDDESSALYGFQ
ncbi:hypothetical protein N8T08_003011 [Aspergillus melleus]|uniref:Uncharacterized protein n=1 Tax=Aspergillus melleus TaxID=138277 RepID=A0ACC3B7W3_9EURO|nr:hypothetical protein N8T08_003011 [Aspergillus melleus]